MRQGAKNIIPFGFGAAAYGFAFGVLAAQIGFPFWGVGLMSVATFSGSSQIVAVERFAGEGYVIGAIIAGMALNLRYIAVLASLSDVLRNVPLAKRRLAVHLTSDENWALTMTERVREPGVGADFLIGSGLMRIAFWTVSIALGGLVGAGIPDLEGLGIGFAFTAAFIAMARGLWRGRHDLLQYAASFAGTVGLVSVGCQGAFAILGGAIVGVATAALRRKLTTEQDRTLVKGTNEGVET